MQIQHKVTKESHADFDKITFTVFTTGAGWITVCKVVRMLKSTSVLAASESERKLTSLACPLLILHSNLNKTTNL